MVAIINKKQNKFLKSRPNLTRKLFGQYFTESITAQYMASLIDLDTLPQNKVLKVIDLGAGHGILSIALAEFLLKHNFTRLEFHCYEVDPLFIPGLIENIEEFKSANEDPKTKLTFKVYNEDVILNRPDLKMQESFDLSIINPPYFKIHSNSNHHDKTKDLFKGNPNVYAAITAIMVNSLSKGGQGVVISPRSFLNGLYFKGFRKYLLDMVSFQAIHIFKSRNDVFKESDILQENIIFKVVKGRKQEDLISILTSYGNEDIFKAVCTNYPASLIIDNSNEENFIRIIEDSFSYKILSVADNLPSSFEGEGYKISTGRVVDFRTREFVKNPAFNSSKVPLIYSHNIKSNGEIFWDGSHKKDRVFIVSKDSTRHLNKNCDYLLLNRFSSKDDKKRLVAGIFERTDSEYIGINNKINYLYREDDWLPGELMGLNTIFNSNFFDNYFRCISGSTQVNATDVRVLKFFKRATVIEIGNSMLEKEFNQKNIDQTLTRFL